MGMLTKRFPPVALAALQLAALQVKGQHFASNARMPEGAKKLYVEILGQPGFTSPSETVQNAKAHKSMCLSDLCANGKHCAFESLQCFLLLLHSCTLAFEPARSDAGRRGKGKARGLQDDGGSEHGT